MLQKLTQTLLLFATLVNCVPLRACELRQILTGVNPCTGQVSFEESCSVKEIPTPELAVGFLPMGTHSQTCEMQKPSLPSDKVIQDFSLTFSAFQITSDLPNRSFSPQCVASAFAVSSGPPTFSFPLPLLF